MIVVAGPEGSGTTYVYQCIAQSLGIDREDYFLSHAEFESGIASQREVLHCSIPSLRARRWISEVDWPIDTRFLFVIRERAKAVQSSYRRFSEKRNEPIGAACASWDYAMELIIDMLPKWEAIVVAYEHLGSPRTRQTVEAFVGAEIQWMPFVRK